MKKSKVNSLIAIVVVGLGLTLTGCKGGGEVAAPTGEVEVKLLCSGTEYFTNEEFFRANAVGESSDQAISMKRARSEANLKLASSLNTKIQAVIDNYFNQREFNNKEEVEERYEGLSREVVNQELTGVKTICEKQTQTPAGKYKTYVAIELSSQELLVKLNERLSKDERLRIDYDYEKFKETFEEEMKKFSEDN